MTATETKIDIDQLVGTVCHYLRTYSDGQQLWEVEPKESDNDYWNKEHANLVLGNGAKLFFSTSRHEGRIYISVDFPRYNGYSLPYERERNGFDGSITVSATKTPAQIAKDVQRRLLNDYLPLYRKGLEIKQQLENKLNAQKALTERLAAIVGETVSNGNGTTNVGHFYIRKDYSEGAGKGISAEVQVNQDGTVDFKRLEVPTELAEQILKLCLPYCGVAKE
jgi:hypothetical protein